jgi:hypothetical protein
MRAGLLKAFVDSCSIRRNFRTLLIVTALIIFSLLQACSEKHDRETTGSIFSIEPVETMSHGRNGSSLTISSYRIFYEYEVDGSNYTGSEFIPNTSGNSDFIRYVNSHLNRKIFTIKYSSEKPGESHLEKRR